MVEKGFIKSKGEIKDVTYKKHEYAYPIQTLKGVDEKIKVKNFLSKYNIFLLGRFGNREYINFDKVIENSFKLTNKLKWK